MVNHSHPRTTGSQEEVDDLKKAYLETGGSIGEILTHIPHSTHDDEARFVMIITSLITKKELKSTRTWEKSVKDEKAKLARKKEGEKEAKEAEELAKELGVWDEFYGSGKATERKKGKGKAAADEGDVSALQALILKKRQKNADDLIDSLAAKYAPKAKGKGKKRAREDDVEEEISASKKKKGRAATPPELDDEEFAKIQERLFGDKAKKAGGDEPKAKKSRARRK
jgi:DnaJ family protein C protein 9